MTKHNRWRGVYMQSITAYTYDPVVDNSRGSYDYYHYISFGGAHGPLSPVSHLKSWQNLPLLSCSCPYSVHLVLHRLLQMKIKGGKLKGEVEETNEITRAVSPLLPPPLPLDPALPPLSSFPTPTYPPCNNHRLVATLPSVGSPIALMYPSG